MPKIEDDYAKKILIGLSISPKCPTELSRIYDIPIALCYERIRKLEYRGLIEHTITLFAKNGKAHRFYQLSCKNRKILVQPLT